MATSTTPIEMTGKVHERGWRKNLRKQLPNYLFILPHYLFFTVFLLYPIVRGIQISLYDWKIMLKDQRFIGLANYEALFRDQIFWEVLGNTFEFMLLTVVINVILALLVASGLKHPFFGSDFLHHETKADILPNCHMGEKSVGLKTHCRKTFIGRDVIH